MKQKQLFITGTALVLAAALTGCSNTPTANQPQSSQQASYISMDAAQSAALDAASIAAADANFSATTLDDVAGITCYKIEFSAGGYDYAYSINAESGEVLEASYHEQAGAAALPDGSTGTTTTQPSTTKPNVGAVTTAPAQTNTPNTNTSTGAVDEAKAQEIALAHAGVKAADATITKSKLDYDDGRQVYEIEWYANGAKYDYEIAVATGEIVNSGYEAKTVVGTGSSATVSEATAKQTALARVSGATEKDIYEWKLDYDDGRPEYEGKIIYGGTEYEFTIDAATGEIISYDYDAESNTTSQSTNTNANVKISEATAKQTALARVSGATEKDIYEWKLDYDDGRPEYEGKIIYGGTEYEFTIDANTGKIIEWDMESIYD